MLKKSTLKNTSKTNNTENISNKPKPYINIFKFRYQLLMNKMHLLNLTCKGLGQRSSLISSAISSELGSPQSLNQSKKDL